MFDLWFERGMTLLLAATVIFARFLGIELVGQPSVRLTDEVDPVIAARR